MNKKSILLIIGLFCFVFGFSSIVMTIVGTNWAFLELFESGGRLVSFVLKIIMAITGMLLIFFSRVDWEKEHSESQ